MHSENFTLKIPKRSKSCSTGFSKSFIPTLKPKEAEILPSPLILKTLEVKEKISSNQKIRQPLSSRNSQPFKMLNKTSILKFLTIKKSKK